MALKGNWKDLQDAIQGVEDSGDDASSEPINRIAHAVIEIEEQLENGGGRGEDGGYYTPTVSQHSEDAMTVSYTPSNSKMPSVPSVRVTLPKGKDGKTPVKGVDYYTEDDKAEMVAAVLAALPNGDEVRY